MNYRCLTGRETLEAERIKLAQQAHLMSVDLEQAREQIMIKNKENLKVGV